MITETDEVEVAGGAVLTFNERLTREATRLGFDLSPY
jgi:hypothetical protein